MNIQETLQRIDTIKSEWPQNIALQSFDKGYFDGLSHDNQLRLLRCMNSGIENPNSSMGAYAGQTSDYDELRPFFWKLIAVHHTVSMGTNHCSNWHLSPSRSLNLESIGVDSLSVRVRVGRNLTDFDLPALMDRDQRLRLEQVVIDAVDDLGIPGRFFSLTPNSTHFIDDVTYQKMIEQHLLFKPMDDDPYLRAAGISSDWPYGRGAFVSSDHTFLIWVGEEDHLRIMVMENTRDLGGVLNNLKSILDRLATALPSPFAHSTEFGFLTSCPTNLGTGMRASVHMKLPKLTQGGSDKRVKELARPLGLAVRGLGGEHTAVGADGTIDISPSARFCITEVEIMERLFNGIDALQHLEATA